MSSWPPTPPTSSRPPSSPLVILTNRPTYALERRPGDASNDLEGNELLIIAIDINDVFTIAALTEAGAAALKYAPGRSTNAVELNARQRDYRLGARFALELRSEAARLKAKRQDLDARHRRALRSTSTTKSTKTKDR